MRTDPNSRSHLDALCNYANEGACLMRLSAELSVCDCDPGRCFILQFNHSTDEQSVWIPQTHTEDYSQNHDEWSLHCVIYSKVLVQNYLLSVALCSTFYWWEICTEMLNIFNYFSIALLLLKLWQFFVCLYVSFSRLCRIVL